MSDDPIHIDVNAGDEFTLSVLGGGRTTFETGDVEIENDGTVKISFVPIRGERVAQRVVRDLHRQVVDMGLTHSQAASEFAVALSPRTRQDMLSEVDIRRAEEQGLNRPPPPDSIYGMQIVVDSGMPDGEARMVSHSDTERAGFGGMTNSDVQSMFEQEFRNEFMGVPLDIERHDDHVEAASAASELHRRRERIRANTQVPTDPQAVQNLQSLVERVQAFGATTGRASSALRNLANMPRFVVEDDPQPPSPEGPSEAVDDEHEPPSHRQFDLT